MISAKFRFTPSIALLAILWSSSSHALLIDSFDTDALAAVTSASPSSSSEFTADSGSSMIGDRTITVDKTAGGSGFSNAAFGEVTGGLLSMSNGPATNSTISSQWVFAATDLTEGGTQTGIFLSMPTPIDNDLYIAFSINGGTEFELLFPNGSQGNDFYFPFADFANAGDAALATSLTVTFRDGIAWDAQVDFIETIGPTPREVVPEPTSLALFGLGIAGLGWSRRKRNS